MKRALFVLALVLGPAIAVAEPMVVPPAPRLEAPREPVHLPTIVIPREEPRPIDKRPFLVAGGILVLAAIFIWNRDRARKLEEEHGATKPRERRWRVKPDEQDADDLADAADEHPDPEDKP